MTNIDKLQEEELAQLDGELNLEDLIILGDDTKIPLKISFPKNDGTKVEAKTLVKQLTIKELEQLKTQNSPWKYYVMILRKGLFKQDGSPFNEEEIRSLPIGVVASVAEKILELSGAELPTRDNQSLPDF